MPPAVAQRCELDLVADPLGVLDAVRGEPHAFALVGRWGGGGAIIGANPIEIRTAPGDPFALLDAHEPAEQASAVIGGGWFGYLGYGVGEQVEQLPPRPPRPVPLADWRLAYYDHLLRLDVDGRWWLESLDDPQSPRLRARVDALLSCLDALSPEGRRSVRVEAQTSSRSADAAPLAFELTPPGVAGHKWAVREAVNRIHAGELFQVNLGLRLSVRLTDGDPIGMFLRGAAATTPAYGAVFSHPSGGLVSLSPELFLRRSGGHVVSGPIKGTVPRGSEEESPTAREQLISSAKDAAEHVMILDLMRNDLGRISEFASVVAERQPRAEAHPGIWHLVSNVEGQLRPGTRDGELLRATFPPGSVTGAPKVQAMKLVSELEGTGRELYTGALGYFSPSAGVELSVGIRTFEISDGEIWLGAGGGIVADSDSEKELEEALAKASPLIRAVGGTLRPPAPAQATQTSDVRGVEQPPSPWSSALTDEVRRHTMPSRPDPQRGVMETVLVRDGELVAFGAHRARMAGSVEQLYGFNLPESLEARAQAAGTAAGDARLRIFAVPRSGELAIELQIAPLPPPQDAVVRLAAVTLPGGLGSHKWADRRLLEALTRELGAVPLLVDSNGDVLEAAWGNIWLNIEGTLHTPPADGRILAGTARMRRLAAAAASGQPCAERRLALSELLGQPLLITSSLREAPAVLDERCGAIPSTDEAVASACRG